MHRRGASSALAAVLGLALSVATLPVTGTATAAGTNPWVKIGNVDDNFNQPGIVVDANGTAHVLWVQPGTSNTANIVHTPVTLTGLLGSSSTVQSGWAAIWPVPDLIATASGVQAFWGGIRTTDPSETNTDVNAATSADGTSWALTPGNVAKGAGDYASNIGAALGAGGTPLQSWAATQGVYVHAGMDPSTQNYDVQGQLGGCCGYDPDIAVDPTSGAAWVAWASNATNHVGVYVQQINPSTGAPVGSATRLPGSATMFNGELQFDQQIERTPIVASKNGVYVAYTAGYPSTNKILLWRLTTSGPSAPRVMASGSDLRTPGVTTDPAGRLWVTWSSHNPDVVHARRSDPKAQQFGATVSISQLPPGGCQGIYELTPAAALPVLDVVGNYSISCSSQQALLVAQLYPGLSVSASPAKFTGRHAVTFTVTDAGVPVAGAKVSAGGKSGTTDSHGKATITLGPVSKKSRIAVTATKLHFTAGHSAVVVLPK